MKAKSHVMFEFHHSGIDLKTSVTMPMDLYKNFSH